MNNKKVLIPFTLVTLITFVSGIALQMTVPTLSVYLKSLDFPLQFLGFAALISALTAFMFRPVAAMLSHRIGPLYTGLIGSFIYVLAYGLFWIVHDPFLIVMIRALQGVAVGLFVTVMGTIIAQIVPHEDLLKGMNIFSLFNAASAAFGPYIGMMLIAGGDFSVMFLVAMILSILVIILIFVLMAQGPLVHSQLPDDSPKVAISIFKSEAVFPSLMVFVLMFFQSGLVAFLAIYGQEINIPNVGFFFLFGFIGLILSRFVVRKLIHAFPLSIILFAFTIAFASINVLIVVQPSVLTWSILSVFHGFVFNMLATLYNTMAIKNVPFELKAKANALYFATIDMGFFLGGIVWGLVASQFGASSIFLITAFFALLIMSYGSWVAHKKEIKF